MQQDEAQVGGGESVLRGGTGETPQIVAASPKRWSPTAEMNFLSELAASCNVRRAAAAAGFGTITVYKRRMADAGFAEQWARALDTGYARLELAVVEAANDTLDDVKFEPDRPIPKMTVFEAIHVLQLHKRTVKQGGRNGSGWRLSPADPAAARASILKKVAALRRARASRRAPATD